MATAHYNDKRQGWELNWVDEQKKKEGHKKPYGRKFITDREYPNMGKKAKVLVCNKWLTFAMEREEECRCLLDGADLNRKINAMTYFQRLAKVDKDGKGEKVAKANSCERTVKKNRLIVRRFATWLENNHPSLYLHQINRAIAIEYLVDIGGEFKRYTVESYRNSLQYVMSLVVQQMEDSDLKYRNGFANLNLDDVLTNHPPAHRKKRYHVESFKMLMSKCADDSDLYDVMVIMWVTGWRLSDILNLNVSQINQEENTLTLVFQKTSNSTKQDVTIPLLGPLKEIFERRGAKHCFYFFPRYSDFAYRTGDWRRANQWRKRYMAIACLNGLGDYKAYISSDGKSVRRMYYYTPHAVRGTVISLLSESGYVEPLVNHLVGHSSGSINQKHYMTFTADTVRPMMETLWDMIKSVVPLDAEDKTNQG